MIKADGFTFREPIQLDLTRGEAFPGIFNLLSKIFMEVKFFSLYILLLIYHRLYCKPWSKSPSKSWTIIISSYNHQQITITFWVQRAGQARVWVW